LNKDTDETAEPIWTHYISKRVTSRVVRTYGGQNNDFTILGGQNSPKPAKLTRRGISQPNPRSRKVAIYRSSMKLFASNFTDR